MHKEPVVGFDSCHSGVFYAFDITPLALIPSLSETKNNEILSLHQQLQELCPTLDRLNAGLGTVVLAILQKSVADPALPRGVYEALRKIQSKLGEHFPNVGISRTEKEIFLRSDPNARPVLNPALLSAAEATIARVHELEKNLPRPSGPSLK